MLGFASTVGAQNTILEARGKTIGTVVTVKGIVTNGAEWGPIRYFQDNTAGIAAYGPLVNTVSKGDSVTITGTLKTYNGLLELDPLTSVEIRSKGNPLPEPILLTQSQVGEAYEGRLVQIIKSSFPCDNFAAGKTYPLTNIDGSVNVFINKSQTDMIGQPIPMGLVNVTAVLSQYTFTGYLGYQLLPRSLADIQRIGSIYLTSCLSNSNFTKTSLDFSWNTNIPGTTQMFYGTTEKTVRANLANGTGGAASHTISLTDLTPGQVNWVQAFSVTGSDTAFSGILPYTTISNSTGNIKVYFNTAVDNSYSTGTNAIFLPQTIDDTLIKYIERAKYSIDLTMYNFNNSGISNVSNALKAAANRGVTVRVIGCGTTNNLGIDELAGSAVHVLIGPSSTGRTGIMHNKFILFDTESANPNEPLVWTGSTNLTDGQINTDANNVIIIQDQSLARAYKIEFEEMWGSDSETPNAAKAKFGFNKKNNTPHEFVIDGKRIECYFSPTDGVNAKIVQNINTSEKDLSVATMLITRTEMADAISARKKAGSAVNVLTNAESGNAAAVNTTLSSALGTHFVFDDVLAGIMHNKYMIVDQSAPLSDPLVLTGSHNWSAAADNDNDENTLVIHDATIANIYYQNFVKEFVGNNGVLLELTGPPVAVNDTVKTPVGQTVTVTVLTNDKIEAPVTLSIEAPAAKNGRAFKPFTNPNAISYEPNAGFEGNDTIIYKIAYKASPSLFATGKILVTVYSNVGLTESAGKSNINVYPNPVQNGNLSVVCMQSSENKGSVQLFDITGKLVYNRQINLSKGENIITVSLPDSFKGAYLLRLTTAQKVWNQKVMFE